MKWVPLGGIRAEPPHDFPPGPGFDYRVAGQLYLQPYFDIWYDIFVIPSKEVDFCNNQFFFPLRASEG